MLAASALAGGGAGEGGGVTGIANLLGLGSTDPNKMSGGDAAKLILTIAAAKLLSARKGMFNLHFPQNGSIIKHNKT